MQKKKECEAKVALFKRAWFEALFEKIPTESQDRMLDLFDEFQNS
jgi:hypothetical protein